MATSSIYRRNVGDRVFVFAICILVLTGEFASAEAQIHDEKVIVKSVESLHQDDEAFDCVHIYKQPAFYHPQLKDHVIQMKPSSYPEHEHPQNLEEDPSLGQLKTVECPPGTVPILRMTLNNDLGDNKLTRVFPPKKGFNQTLDIIAPSGHEYAQLSWLGNGFHGAHGIFNVWNPHTEDDEFSLAQVWVIGGSDNNRNTIEAGWIVGNVNDKPRRTRFFTYWTADNYESTGCYNLICPGFVQVNRKFVIGAPIEPVSSYNGKQFEIDINIHKDQKTGNWWLRLQNVDLGYWPNSIFTSLRDSSNLISWGGEIINRENDGHHTTTQMGSGHFPSELLKRAAYIRNLLYVDGSGESREPGNLLKYVTKNRCYDLERRQRDSAYGVHFFFGGPGFSAQCPN